MESTVPPWVTLNYEPIATCILRVADLLRQYGGRDNIELELRLCSRPDSGNLVSNVGFEVSDSFVQQCSNEGPKALVFGQWAEHVDYFYNDLRGLGIRTRVSYDSDTCTVDTCSVHKTRIIRDDVAVGSQPYGIRVCVSREEPVEKEHLPPFANPSSVRISQRCTATTATCCEGEEIPVWRYDITMSWIGASRSEAEQKQRDTQDGVEYTIELEYIGGLRAVERLGAHYVACSGLLKVLDIVDGRESACQLLSDIKDE